MATIASFINNEIQFNSREDLILCDLDDTVLHLAPKWINLFNQKTSKNLDISNWKHYDFTKCDGFTPDFRDILNHENLFRDLEPMEGAIEALFSLSENFVILLCTHAVHGKAADQKYDWIHKHIKLSHKNMLGSLSDHIITAKHKSIIDAYAIIDDNPLNALGHKKAFRSYALGIKHPWNERYYREYDLLADSYQTPKEAWSRITDFLVANKNQGKRFNAHKKQWYLLPRLATRELIKYKRRIEINSISIEKTIEWLMNWYVTNSITALKEACSLGLGLAGFQEKADLRCDSIMSYLPLGLAAVTDVMKFGTQKYNERNWEKGLPVEQCFSSAMRHYEEILKGRMIDPESKLHHSYHAAWNLLVMLEITLRSKKSSDYRIFTKRYNWRQKP